MALPAGGSPDAKSKALRVLVIGAGAAGLSVASCLQGAKRRSGAAGFSVAAFLPGKRATQDGTELENIEITVLEARARLGGRICTERFADSSAVDLGAAWLHGTSRSNPLVALAKECGAQLVETDWDNALMFEAVGDEAEPRPSIPIKETEWKRTEKHFESMMQLFYEKQSADRKDAKRGQLTDRSLMQTLRDLKSRKFLGIESLDKRSQLLLLSAIAGETEHDYAATADELSSTWWDIDDEFDGEHALWRDGFVQIIEHLAAGVQVVQDAAVSKIEWSESAVGPPVVVRCQDGRSFEADLCVCTMPLGVLQRDGGALFQPPLPESKLQALRHLGVGVLEKVALRFEQCFWETNKLRPHCLYRVATVEARATPAARESPYMVSLRPATGSNVLVAYFTTGTGRVMAKLSEDEAAKTVLGLLKSMFPPEEVDAAKLLEVKKTAWTEDEWACGGYSFLPVGATEEDRNALAAPLGPLHFAGEATHDRYPATVHGAILSGRRAAAEIRRRVAGYPKS